ncbi:GGDEF domain-containing protein [Pseudoflavonifractor sp. MSJ-37]|nr:GGDEF domain-containing protein [Pseudoflavonifractor sp. MSJ-37]
MDGKIRIQRLSVWSIRITIVAAALFAVLFALGNHEFHVLHATTEQYFLCEDAANQLQAGSDYLTEQVRLYAMTGEWQYMDHYFEEANVTRRRENALEALRADFDGTEAFQALHEALVCSDQLMDTEYYSMRLVSEANGIDPSFWPKEVAAVSPTSADQASTKEEKLSKAQMLVFSDQYQKARTSIRNDVSQCLEALVASTRSQQSRASAIFSDMYLKLELGVCLLAALTLAMCMMVRHSIVKPLMSYNESIQRGEIFPVIGAAELQTLAVTYNKVYQENRETQMLIRHEAEHDALTDLLNRGSFDRILQIYLNGDSPFALILMDVDTFKQVNDTYGHAAGDQILKKVAKLLMTTFRSNDYVCRIGGDEFAVIMVEMTSDLAYTIQEKIDYINGVLSGDTDGLAAVSLSAGIAFSDREEPSESLFNDADLALYHTKKHGKHGCHFYGPDMLHHLEPDTEDPAETK